MRDASITIIVKVTPRGGKDEIEHVMQNASGQIFMKLRVKAPPEDGKANKAVQVLIAKTFNMPVSNFCITKGLKSRAKMVRVSEPEMLMKSKAFLEMVDPS